MQVQKMPIIIYLLQPGIPDTSDMRYQECTKILLCFALSDSIEKLVVENLRRSKGNMGDSYKDAFLYSCHW